MTTRFCRSRTAAMGCPNYVAQSLYDCGVGAQVSRLTPPTHALAEGLSDTCSPKDNRPDLNLQRVLTI
jgi:hypothetical protein